MDRKYFDLKEDAKSGKQKVDFSIMDHIYVRLPNWVGDVVMALPFLAVLRRTFPQARIQAGLRRHLVPLVLGCRDADAVMEISPEDEHRPRAIRQWVLRLRRERFDAAFLLSPSFSSALPAFLAKIPRRVGWKSDGRSMLLTHGLALDRPVHKRPLARQYCDLIQRVHAPPLPEPPWPELHVLPVHAEAARRAAERCGLAFLTRPLIVLNVAATYGRAKTWIPGRFASLAGRLKIRYGCTILLAGSPQDAEALLTARGFMGDASDGVFIGDRQHGIAELVGVLGRADALVTNDTGASHVAAALGVPVLAVYGSTTPAWTPVQGPKARWIYHPPECSPCFKKECPKKRHFCMENVSVQEVLAEIEKMAAFQ